MLSSRMLLRVALVGTDVSEENIASNIRVERISELGIALVLTSNQIISSLRASFVSYC
jgi:hypothetical protein